MNNEQQIVEEVLKQCEHLEDVLNNKLLKKFAEIHNVKSEYNMLNLKQEVLAKTSAFFTKKKYALWIINKERKPVDEYDLKGMINRRSNFAEFSKQTVEKLLDLILKEDVLDLDKIDKFVEKSIEEADRLCKNHDKSIAGAVSYNKNIEDYKNNRTPYQVDAMELWNNLEYEYFAAGSKGFLFRILGVDVNKAPKRILDKLDYIGIKNKQIVLPFEEDKLPEYYILDLESQMKFVIHDRIQEIMQIFKGESIDDLDNLIDQLFE